MEQKIPRSRFRRVVLKTRIPTYIEISTCRVVTLESRSRSTDKIMAELDELDEF